jgi:hypothetical protein
MARAPATPNRPAPGLTGDATPLQGGLKPAFKLHQVHRPLWPRAGTAGRSGDEHSDEVSIAVSHNGIDRPVARPARLARRQQA